MEGMSSGGLLAIGIAHVTATPRVTGGRDTHTPTYQKGEMAIQAHEKIGMGEVKIHSVLLRD
jgi:hypothetical protein